MPRYFSAINSALGENLFVAALSNVPVEVTRNVDLILNRAWIDVPVRFDLDAIEIDLSAFEAGEIPRIPVVEILS
jgi:uncharacterized protein (TIGR02217 family)